MAGEGFRLAQTLFARGEVYFATPAEFNDPGEGGFRFSWPGNPYEGMAADYYSREARERTGILSLSAKPDDVLMWSHYSNSHQGLCVGFSTSMQPFAGAKEVVYSENLPMLLASPHVGAEALIEAACLSKAAQWSYECEWRIVRRPGLCLVPREAVVEVILGFRMPEELQWWAKEWARIYVPHAKLLRAVLSEGSYQMQLVEA